MKTTYAGIYFINFGDWGNKSGHFFIATVIKRLFWNVNLVKIRFRYIGSRREFSSKGLNFVNDLPQYQVIQKRYDMSTPRTLESKTWSSGLMPAKEGTMIMYQVNNIHGDYVGTPEDALRLHNMNIIPELKFPEGKTCSIGFSEEKQKWYGWSHRALFGFGIGSKVELSGCGYSPSNKEEMEASVRKWYEEIMEYPLVRIFEQTKDDKIGLAIFCKGKTNAKGNEMEYEHFEPYPKQWGRGEWTAKTIEDAKEMAIDFANSVS